MAASSRRPGWIWLIVAIAWTHSELRAQDQVDFDSQIRPILSDNCYYCHGPDEAHRATDLRLDQRESMFSDLGGYVAVQPNQPDESELILRIDSDDPGMVMPPPDHRKKLSESQKKLLRTWIEQGANWSAHWSYQPVNAGEVPQVKDASWVRNYIDHYILSRLESKGIAPADVAERRTLIRRLSFDLTGLPPDRAALAKADRKDWSDAYEELIDELLARPAFGERMAVYWLDLVRYADSVGYHGDQPVSVSPFRDYVIDAFNSNMPFDQFTAEQLAGDLLENPTQQQLIASGYNRLGMMSAEGGVQPEEYLAKYAADRVRTTASVWLGITLGCAECHDHKFDPFSTKEFYEFQAFFADIKERGLYEGAHQSRQWGPTIEVPDEILPNLLKPIDKQISELTATLVETADVAEERKAWESSVKNSDFRWQSLEPTSVKAFHPVDIAIQNDQSVLIGGENPNENVYVVAAHLPKDARAIRLEVLPHDSLPKKGPGRAGNGNFVVSEMIIVQGDHTDRIEKLKAVFESWPEDLKKQTLELNSASATIEQEHGGNNHPDKKWSANSAVDRDGRGSVWGWAVLPELGKPNELVVRIAEDAPATESVTIVLQQYHGNGSHTLGNFRLSASSSSEAVADPFKSLPVEIRNIINQDEASRSTDEQKTIVDYFLKIAPSLQPIHKKVAELSAKRQGLVEKHTRTSLVTVSVPPREIRVLPRGNWMDRSGPVVTPNVPSTLGRPEWESPPTRKELAQWLTSDENPLTARVFTNRMWKLFFGEGLAPVLDDLGSQGQAPTHPQLLDRMAWEFQTSGWDVKQLIKSIVMSQSYQQSSASRKDLAETDPENRLFARQGRYRIEAEFVRDHALSTSGLLVMTVGGKSVKPYQPPGLYQHLNFPRRTYQADSGDDQYRRGVYTHWQRQYLHPAMKIFDAPPREECTAARPRSSTPLAALVLLNDPSYVEAARAMAERIIKSSSDSNERLDELFLLAFGRSITDSEREILMALLASHQKHYSENRDAAAELLAVGDSQRDESLNQPEHAAWTSVCRAVINMHEFVTRK